MKPGSYSRKLRWLPVGLLLLCVGLLCLFLVARRCRPLSCVAQAGAAEVRCVNVASSQVVKKLPLSDSQELIIESVKLTRQPASASLDVTLRGEFWNEADQNLYLFIGRALPAGQHSSYSLSSDTQYFADLSYPVRNTIELPHSNDVRIGVMAAHESAYTPQVYISDPVYADLVGTEAHVRIDQRQHLVSLELPLAEYYELTKEALPVSLSLTLATARDYVGFVDQISVMNVSVGETKFEDKKRLPPIVYPMLSYESHLFKNVTLKQVAGAVRVEVEMESEIEDWAQTNLHFFLVPYPPHEADALFDPSKTVKLPYAWSYYCGVYSPNRIFCKASGGRDFSYDSGYAKRSALEKMSGVQFRAPGKAQYVIEFAPENLEKIKEGGDAFALLLMAGRDGFGPTSFYGWEPAKRCGFLNRFLPIASTFRAPLAQPCL